MRRTSRGLMAGVIAAIGATFGAHPAAACLRHTFEPCPATASTDYVVEVDSKTGRTWMKDRPANAEAGEWKTQFSAEAARAPRAQISP